MGRGGVALVGGAIADHMLPTSDAFRAAVGGVKVGYAGHIPNAQTHFGASHFGRVEAEDPGGPARSAPPRRCEFSIPRDASIEQGKSLPLPSRPYSASTTGAAGGHGLAHNALARRVVCHPSPHYGPPSRRQSEIAIGYGGHRQGARDAGDRAVHDLVGAFNHRGYTTSRRGQLSAGSTSSAALEVPLGSQSDRSTEASRQLRSADQICFAPAAGRVPAHNDWRVHSEHAPPPVPDTAKAYVAQVGGIVPGYAGFVPRSQSHYGSSHLGGVRGPVGGGAVRSASGAQRGHVGKTSHKTLRVQARKEEASQRASSAAISYAGHRPTDHHTFGVAYYRPSHPNEGLYCA